jgi:hypothetical protein
MVMAAGMGYLLVYSWSLRTQVVRGELIVMIRNDGNETMRSAELLVETLWSPMIDFGSGFSRNETSTLVLFRSPTLVMLHAETLQPGETKFFEIDGIRINRTLVDDFSSIRINVQRMAGASGKLYYELIFRIIGSNVVEFSLASLTSFEYGNEGLTYFRTDVLRYVPLAYVGCVSILAALFWNALFPQRAIFFPYFTFAQATVALCLFIFCGSGPEAMSTTFRNPWLFLPVSTYYHAGNWHIDGNLVTFLPVSIAFEFSTRKLSKWKERLKWLALPWVSDLAWGLLPLVLFSRAGGYGMSLMVEAAVWVFWAYLLMKWPDSLASRLDLCLALLSGFSSYTFFGWAKSIILSDYRPDTFNYVLAWKHVAFGIVVLVAAGAFVIHRLKQASARTRKPTPIGSPPTLR